MPSPTPNPRMLVRVNLDQLCRNLSLRLGMSVNPERAARWLRSERFEPVDNVWVCDRQSLEALEPDEFETLGPWNGRAE